MQYNVPRVPVDQTDLLTEYDFEYEFLLKAAYNNWLKETANNRQIDLADGGVKREFSMDEDEYNEIIERSENGEFIDLGIPSDAPNGKRLSESLVEKEPEPSDQVPVDLNQIFGGGKNG